MSILISAVICTHSRAPYLIKAIGSLINQSIPKAKYEIIVVDNCSTDNTSEVVKKFSGAANLSYLYESNLGLSHARNNGWRNARGKYIAYLDDDAIACPIWLEKILEVFENVRPRPACVGGKAEPIWEAPRPEWLSDRIASALTIADWSDQPHPIVNLEQEWLVGANIAFPVEFLESVGGFTSHLGRVGKHLLSGEEVLLQRQALKTGYSCFYHPEIAVGHHILRSRLQKRWFLSRYYWQGITDAAIKLMLMDKDSRMSTRMNLALSGAWDVLRFPTTLAKGFLPTSSPSQFTEICLNLYTVGHTIGLLGMQRR